MTETKTGFIDLPRDYELATIAARLDALRAGDTKGASTFFSGSRGDSLVDKQGHPITDLGAQAICLEAEILKFQLNANAAINPEAAEPILPVSHIYDTEGLEAIVTTTSYPFNDGFVVHATRMLEKNDGQPPVLTDFTVTAGWLPAQSDIIAA